MKMHKLFLMLTAALSVFVAVAQTPATTSGYVAKNGGSFNVEQIYLRGSSVHQRTGFSVFPISGPDPAHSVILNLTLKKFRADLASTIAIDFHGASGDLFSPLESESDAFASAPAPESMDSIGVVTIDSTITEGDVVSIDITETYNKLITSGEDLFTIRINSETSNAFAQFYASDTTAGPSLDIILEKDVVTQSPVVDGFLRNGQDFASSEIYIRGQGGTSAGFHREGYLVLDQKETFDIVSAKLELTPFDIRATGTAPDSVPQFILGIAEGDLISNILNDGTVDWDQRPADDSFTVIDTVILHPEMEDARISIDLTQQIQAFITNGTTGMYTLRMMDTTANSTLIRFRGSSYADESMRPNLTIISSCADELVEVDTIVCSTSVPFTLEAEEAANNVQVSENGVYDVLFSTPCGAVLTKRYTVDIIDNGEFTEDVQICYGEEFLGKTESGTFIIEKVSDDGTCTEKITYNLTVNPLPQPDLGDDVTIKDDESIAIDAGEWESYLWSTGETTQKINVELASENYVLGPNIILVDVTDANGCVGSDTVVVTINDRSVPTITEFPTLREDKNGFFDLGTRIEIKNDLFGDTNTPEGEGPFYNRILFMEFDVSAIADELGDGQLTSVVVQLYNYDNDEITANDRDKLTHDTNVDLGASLQAIDPNWTWETQPDRSQYPIQDVVLIKEDSVPGYHQWDVTDFVANEVIGTDATTFSVRMTAQEDTASTLIKFRSPSWKTVSERPKLLYTIGDEVLSIRGEIEPMLLAYPNPANDVIRLRADYEVTSYRILSVDGRILQQSEIEDSSNVEISIDSLKNGVYLLQLQTAKGQKTSRFIKE